MATKSEGCPCYDAAGDDEPIFTLRAQDVLSPDVVEFWIEQARQRGVNEDKLAEAQRCADAMRAWSNRRRVIWVGLLGAGLVGAMVSDAGAARRSTVPRPSVRMMGR